MFNQEWLYFDFLEYGYNKGIKVKYVQINITPSMWKMMKFWSRTIKNAHEAKVNKQNKLSV